jgi:hypothetical protein
MKMTPQGMSRRERLLIAGHNHDRLDYATVCRIISLLVAEKSH